MAFQLSCDRACKRVIIATPPSLRLGAEVSCPFIDLLPPFCLPARGPFSARLEKRRKVRLPVRPTPSHVSSISGLETGPWTLAEAAARYILLSTSAKSWRVGR